jgi:MFS family permease
VGVIGSIGSLLMAPFYGYLLDKRGPFLAIILVLVLCTVGCLIRGLATEMYWYYVGQCVLGFGGGNLTTVVIAFVTSSTSRERRTLVMSGALLPAAARCCSLLLTAVHCMHPAASRCCPLLLTAVHCGPLLIAAALYTYYICL